MKLILPLIISIVSLGNLAVAEQPRPDPVKIGVVLPLTGEYGTWGERVRQGLELALEDTKHPFALDFQDEGNCDSKTTLGAVTKFLSVDGLKIVFMGCLAGTKAVGPIALREGALLLSTGLLDDEVYAKKYPVVNLATQLSTESRFLAAHIAKKGARKVALLHWPDAFGEEFARSLARELKDRGIEVPFSDSSLTMGADFRSVILRIRQTGADAVATNLGDAQIQSFMKQLKETQVSLQVFSNYVVETNTAPTELLNGIEYTYPVNASENAADKLKFDARFAARFKGEQPSANTYFAYDGLVALDMALDACKVTDTSCIRSYFLDQVHTGLSGAVHFLPDGSNLRPFGAKRVEKSGFVWLERDLKLK